MHTNFQIPRTAAAVLAVIACAMPAISADSARVGAYDFSYLTSGDTRARPVQVFDDGRSTYFQFRAGEPVPAIFAARDGEPTLVVLSQEGPYVRVPDLHGRFVLQVGRSQAHVVRGDAARGDGPPITVVAPSGMTTPYTPAALLPAGARLVASLSPTLPELAQAQALDRNSYATPARGDRTYWVTRNEQVEHSVHFARGGYVLSREAHRRLGQLASRGASRYIVIGRDDDTYKEGLETARAIALRDGLIKVGVPADRITMRTGVMRTPSGGNEWESTVLMELQQEAPAMHMAPVQPPRPALAVAQPRSDVPEGGFTMTTADKSVQGAVRRWAQALDYQLVWDAPAELDAPISGGAVVLPGRNITEALGVLERGLKEKGYLLEVTIYANRVIRISAPAPAATEPAAQGARVMAGPAAPTMQQWQMVPADRTVAGTLARWTNGSKWNVVWSAKEQVPVTGAATVSQPDFRAAAEYVMQQVATAGYRLRVSSQGDSTLVVSSF